MERGRLNALPQTTPAWVALTAYEVGARVTATTPDGLNWYATTAGTSGPAEPTWPTSDPWTVVDGGVTWRLATSFRQMAMAGLYATLVAFRSANPWALKGLATARPANLGNLDLPGAYIDGADETITHNGGTRTRTMSGLGVMVVLPQPDNAEAENAMDAIIDALMDAFTAAYHAVDGSSILVQTAVTEVPLDEDGGHYLGNRITFGQTSKTEGRN